MPSSPAQSTSSRKASISTSPISFSRYSRRSNRSEPTCTTGSGSTSAGGTTTSKQSQAGRRPRRRRTRKRPAALSREDGCLRAARSVARAGRCRVSGVEGQPVADGRASRPQASRIEYASIIVPMLDEETRVGGLVADIAAQKFAGELELLVADGGSRDRSLERLRAAASRHDLPLTLVENRDRLIPHGLNACIRRARGDLIVRMDCRAHYPHDYLERCIAAAEETGAWNVGGLTVPVGRSRMGALQRVP